MKIVIWSREPLIQGPLFSYRIVGQCRRQRRATLEEDSFDLLLLDRGEVPIEALEAPLASWVLARLTAEAGLGGAYADARQSSDGGAYSLHFEVTAGKGDSAGESVANFELLGYTWCVELLGRCEGASPTDVVNDFADLLLARPSGLGQCRVSVYDNEWQDHPEEYDPRWPAKTDRNVYGWNGTRFLGTDNFWNAAEIEHPWPGESYRGYHERSLATYRAGAKTEKLEIIEAISTKTVEIDDDDATDDVVAEVCADLGRFLGNLGREAVIVRVYDLDGELVQNESISQDALKTRVGSWIEEGLDVAWRMDEDSAVIKVWEYPASEPPWAAVLAEENYQPEIAP